MFFVLSFCGCLTALVAASNPSAHMRHARRRVLDIHGESTKDVQVDAAVASSARDVGISVDAYGNLAEVASTSVVDCMFQRVSEDDDSVSYESYVYGECHAQNGTVYNLVDDHATELLNSGDSVTLSLELASAQTLANPELIPPWADADNKFYKVVSYSLSAVERTALGRVTHNTSFVESSRRRIALESDLEGVKIMRILVILCKYSDFSDTKWPRVGDVNKIASAVWGKGKSGSFSQIIEKSTFGRLKVPSKKGQIVTVNMNKEWKTEGDGKKCPRDVIKERALANLREQYPDIDPNSFAYHQFHIPASPSRKCNWSGVGIGVCNPSNLPRVPSPCPSFFRAWSYGGGASRAYGVRLMLHELGHTFGLAHASGDDSGSWTNWGDASDAMGTSVGYRYEHYTRGATSYSASSLFLIGVLKDQEIITISKDKALFKTGPNNQIATVVPIEAGPSALKVCSEKGEKRCAVAVRIKCDECVFKGTWSKLKGGYIWVQFRGSESWAAKSGIDTNFKNKVFVHFDRRTVLVGNQHGAEKWAVLAPDGSYWVDALNAHITFCSKRDGLAKISIASADFEASKRCK